MALVKDVYLIVKNYPKEETYAITSHTKRAAVSIAANIAEGIGRNHKKDTIQFLHIARGSLYELETLLLVAVSLDFATAEKNQVLMKQIKECLRLLNGLITYFEKSDLK